MISNETVGLIEKSHTIILKTKTASESSNNPPDEFNTKKIEKRIIQKNGECNVFQPLSKRQRFVFLQFTRLVDSSWTWTLFVFLATLLLSWYGFAVLWWLICYTHGDFEPNHLPPFQKKNNFKPCVYHMHNFASCFLFSIETQHTVGYGVKATTEECPEAIFVNAMQCIIGFIMQGFMAVIIFAKMTLPRLRSKTLLFSKKAVVCPRNGQLCLMFRMGDMRKNHIIDANVRAFLVSSKRTIEGEILSHCQTELRLSADDCKSGLFFNWPLVIVHKIDNTSPLYYYSPSDILRSKFEIVVVLEGTIQSTGQMTQAKTSYIGSDIEWGNRFESLLNFNVYRNEYEADFSKFDNTLPISTPLCSAAYCQDHKKMGISGKLSGSKYSVAKFDFSPRKSIGDISTERPKDKIIQIQSCNSGTGSESI